MKCYIVLITLGVIGHEAIAAEDVIVVTAQRLAPAASETVLATTDIDRTFLTESDGLRLDDALRTVPGFGLFRRQSSSASHPTTQGVTLRGLGPSGAGRTLVLLDGIPQNDPFGGWIDWSRLPAEMLEDVSLTRGGGAGPWGNAALAGTIRMTTRVPTGTEAIADININTFGAVDGLAIGHTAVGQGRVTAAVGAHTGDGPYLIRADQRGAVDTHTHDRGELAEATFVVPVANGTELTLHGAYSLDQYVNGIALAKSRVRTSDGAVGLTHHGAPDELGWELHGYVRDENQPAVFSSVAVGRATATPSLNQFSVPATGAGGNGILRIPVTSTLAIDTGFDVRYATGATHEDFTFVAPAFTRVRDAGGDQVIAGGFVEGNWTPTQALTLTAAARLDWWQQSDGYRHETVIATGVVARDDHDPTMDGTISNFRVGARYDVSPAWSLRAAGYTGFRVPTINELYRPFRVGNDITEANPTLRPERLQGVEAGTQWKPATTLAFDVTVFASRLRNAVGNITIQTTPGLNALLNVVVPAGGTLRQRQNIDLIQATGVEASATWAATDSLDVTARYLYTSPHVARSVANPALNGLDLADVSRHQGSLAIAWRPWSGAVWRAEGQVQSRQFDDDQNTRHMHGYAIVDLYVEQALTGRITAYARAENLFDHTIEAGLAADGTVTVGRPRVATAGMKVKL